MKKYLKTAIGILVIALMAAGLIAVAVMEHRGNRRLYSSAK